MAYNRYYTEIGFINDSAPPLNADNLNKMDTELFYISKALRSTKYLTETLATGETSVAFSDVMIAEDTTFITIATDPVVNYVSASISDATLTITFNAQTTDINVAVKLEEM